MLTRLSEDLLLAIKKDKSPNKYLVRLKNIQLKELQTDKEKLTFWINIYNAYFLIFDKEEIPRNKIFKIRDVEVGHNRFSLDEIEHGILRKRKWKFSLGYLPSLLYRPIIKKLEVKKLDYRIHFALNCGAKSCPPIAFYHHDSIDRELEMATQSFIEQEVFIHHEKRNIELSKIFLWYKGDFGGNKNIKKIIKKYLPSQLDYSDYEIIYKKYDYTPSHHFRE